MDFPPMIQNIQKKKFYAIREEDLTKEEKMQTINVMYIQYCVTFKIIGIYNLILQDYNSGLVKSYDY